MADKKISDFTAIGSLATADLFEIETAAGNSRKMTGTQLLDFLDAEGVGNHAYEGFGDLTSLAGLTLLSGASANLTLTDGIKRHLFTWTASGANAIQMAYQSAPATPWDVYVRLNVRGSMGTNVQFGLALRNSTSGKIFFLALNTNTTISCQEWTNPTTFSSSLATTTIVSQTNIPIWLHIGNDGTTLTARYSWNGVDWYTLTTRTLATFMGSIDHIGLGCVPQSAQAADVSDFGLVTPT